MSWHCVLKFKKGWKSLLESLRLFLWRLSFHSNFSSAFVFMVFAAEQWISRGLHAPLFVMLRAGPSTCTQPNCDFESVLDLLIDLCLSTCHKLFPAFRNGKHIHSKKDIFTHAPGNDYGSPLFWFQFCQCCASSAKGVFDTWIAHVAQRIAKRLWPKTGSPHLPVTSATHTLSGLTKAFSFIYAPQLKCNGKSIFSLSKTMLWW